MKWRADGKFMRRARKQEWHRWYAWYPILVLEANYEGIKVPRMRVWLEPVERLGEYNGYRAPWDRWGWRYRLPTSEV